MNDIPNRVWQGLAALGNTDAQVIASLKSAGHRGQRWDGENCVFANYIKGIFFEGEVTWVCVDIHCIQVHQGEQLNAMLTPDNIVLLIDDFDSGLMPELVKD